MSKAFLKDLSQASYVEYGYAQVEPNHLSAQRTGQIYAQLPADPEIKVLENGQFVKYDYEKGLVNFDGEGEWMLVYNEPKLYRDGQDECEFAMIKRNYAAKVYSPSDGVLTDDAKSRDYTRIVAPADPYSLDATEDPFHIYSQNEVALMPADTTMVPRVFKTNIGDIFTTNCVNGEVAHGAYLAPAADNGILTVSAEKPAEGMVWQIVKVYTMPDYQKGVKIMRIA